LARQDFQALNRLLVTSKSSSTFFGTSQPTVLDVVAFAQVGAIHMLPELNTPLRAALREFPELVRFIETTAETYYPELHSKFTANRG
jgi:hypothetical protein